MIIIHEYMDKHIKTISDEIEKVYGLKNIIISADLSQQFTPTKKWKGYIHSDKNLESFVKKYGNLKTAILTPRDIYIDENFRDEDWIFGYCDNLFTVTSTARMKRHDNKPSKEIIVPEKLYLKRVISMLIHEIAHDVVKSDHLLPAKLISVKNNYELPLGPHCTDNKCVLYEIIDLKAPPKEDSYLLLGDEKKFDAGMDECIDRRYDGWFCKKCKDSMVLGEGYF